MLGRIGGAAVALAAAATLAFGVGSAAAESHAGRPLCRIGQSPASAKCTANPAFAKTICATFVPALQQVAPQASFNRGYAPSWTGTAVNCFYTVDGHPQAVNIAVMGGAFGSSTAMDGSRVSGKAQAARAFKDTFDGDMKLWAETSKDACPYLTQAELTQAEQTNGPDGIPQAPPKKTTVGGYPAFTWDPCQTPTEKVGNIDPATYYVQHTVVVLVGDEFIRLIAGVRGVNSSTQLFPLAQQLINTYKKFE